MYALTSFLTSSKLDNKSTAGRGVGRVKGGGGGEGGGGVGLMKTHHATSFSEEKRREKINFLPRLHIKQICPTQVAVRTPR